MSRELPIIMGQHDVRAILEGRKTVTRRVVSRIASLGPVTEFGRSDTAGYDWHCRDRRALWNDLREAELLARCPYGQVGDRLYVRERFKPIASGQVKNGYGEVRYGYAYEADGATRWNERPTIIHDLTGQPNKGPMQFRPSPWRAAVTMPHRASRIILKMTAVRVERLQDISEAQAHAEGIRELPLQNDEPGAWWCADPLGNTELHCRTPRAAFCRLWESINGAGSWADNPWVWVVEFKRIETEAAAT